MTTPPMPAFTGFNPTQQAQYDALEARYAVPAAPVILLLGDSLCMRWPEAQWSTLHASIANLGIGGARVQDVAWQVQNTAITLSAVEVVYVIVGVNNLNWLAPGAYVAAWCRGLAKVIRDRVPGVRVVFQKMTPYLPLALPEFNAELAALSLSTGKFEVTDVGLPVSALGDPALCNPDGVHIEAAAYEQYVTPAAAAALGG